MLISYMNIIYNVSHLIILIKIINLIIIFRSYYYQY